MDNYLKLCPEMKRVADALKDSDYAEDRSVAAYLQAKLDEMENDTFDKLSVRMHTPEGQRPITESERKMMSMRYFKGLGIPDICRRTGFSQQYVRNMCSRACARYVIGKDEFWTAGGELE